MTKKILAVAIIAVMAAAISVAGAAMVKDNNQAGLRAVKSQNSNQSKEAEYKRQLAEARKKVNKLERELKKAVNDIAEDNEIKDICIRLGDAITDEALLKVSIKREMKKDREEDKDKEKDKERKKKEK